MALSPMTRLVCSDPARVLEAVLAAAVVLAEGTWCSIDRGCGCC